MSHSNLKRTSSFPRDRAITNPEAPDECPSLIRRSSIIRLNEPTEGIDELPTDQPDLLYVVDVDDKNGSNRRFYSDQKISGWKDPLDDEKSEAAKFELYRCVQATNKAGVSPKRSMMKHEWCKRDLVIDLKKDCVITRFENPILRVYSAVVRSTLKQVITYDPKHTLEGSEMISFVWPYRLLLQHYDNLETFIKNLEQHDEVKPPDLQEYPTSTIIEHVAKLLKLIEPEYNNIFIPEVRRHKEDGGVAFDNLWILFTPGELVFCDIDGEPAAFIVIGAEIQRWSGPEKSWGISIWNYRLVGGRLQRHTSKVKIPEFTGTRLITSLDVYPARYLRDDKRQEIINKLDNQGKKFFNTAKTLPSHMGYKGMTLGRDGTISWSDSKPRLYNGHIILDPVSFISSTDRPVSDMRWRHDWDPLLEDEVASPPDFGGGKDWEAFDTIDPAIASKEKELEAGHYILFPRRIRGISLTDKQWETYDIACVTPIEWEDGDKVLQRLVIDEESKKVIKATCRTAISRQKSPEISADWIDGKGAGQIFLFYGGPGTGKTLTVECIAQYTHQPILALSGADLTFSKETEAKLDYWFKLATRWDALLLIDEAEVYMEQREPNNIERNSLVTIFLRKIEYYTGMLFLTTNRIGKIDAAIKSRVQVSIHYKDFDLDSRKALWRSYFDKLKSKKSPATPTPEVVEEFLKHQIMQRDMNGRDVRNALQHAIRVTRFYGTVDIDDIDDSQKFALKVQHLVTAVQMREALTKELVEANEMENEQALAHARHERAHKRRASTNESKQDKKAKLV